MSTPNNLKYVDTHEWVKVEGNEGVVGLSQHAQELLGDVVYLELPKVGDSVSQSSSIGVVESVKAASDIYSPVSGEVVAVNDAVLADPALINQDAYGKAWLYRVKLSNPSEVNGLLSAEDYQKLIG